TGGDLLLQFQVQDTGGTLNGCVDLDPTQQTMTIHVNTTPPVDHAPLGTTGSVTALEDVTYQFTAANFGFSDPNDTPANNFFAVKVSSLPATGSLKDNGNP